MRAYWWLLALAPCLLAYQWVPKTPLTFWLCSVPTRSWEDTCTTLYHVMIMVISTILPSILHIGICLHGWRLLVILFILNDLYHFGHWDPQRSDRGVINSRLWGLFMPLLWHPLYWSQLQRPLSLKVLRSLNPWLLLFSPFSPGVSSISSLSLQVSIVLPSRCFLLPPRGLAHVVLLQVLGCWGPMIYLT